ncbi:MAG: hypothetical protein ABI565_07660 [Vicinamibacteria bacterium]
MRASRILLALLLPVLVGLSIFGRLAYQAVGIESVAPATALARFEAVRGRFADRKPMLEVDAAGQVRPRTPSSRSVVPPSTEPTRLQVLAYYVEGQRLVKAEVPFWFLKLKGPAAQFALRDTGLDLERLHVTAEGLAREGPGLVLDQTRPNGDRLLVWTE